MTDLKHETNLTVRYEMFELGLLEFALPVVTALCACSDCERKAKEAQTKLVNMVNDMRNPIYDIPSDHEKVRFEIISIPGVSSFEWKNFPVTDRLNP